MPQRVTWTQLDAVLYGPCLETSKDFAPLFSFTLLFRPSLRRSKRKEKERKGENREKKRKKEKEKRKEKRWYGIRVLLNSMT